MLIPLRDTQPSYSPPIVTVLLIIVNVFVFLYEVSLDSYSLNHLIAVYGIVPDRLNYLTLLTSMFLHGGWAHVGGNMLFLWIYGDNVEDVLGHFKYLLFYLVCGLAAGLVHVYLNPYSRIPTVGASGAIAGVMGAYLLKFRHAKVEVLVFFFFFTFVEIPAPFLLIYWFVVQLFSGIGSIAYSQASEGGVAVWAHVGGFLAGMLLIKLMGSREKYRRRPQLHW